MVYKRTPNGTTYVVVGLKGEMLARVERLRTSDPLRKNKKPHHRTAVIRALIKLGLERLDQGGLSL